jgi:hypothetical protein
MTYCFRLYGAVLLAAVALSGGAMAQTVEAREISGFECAPCVGKIIVNWNLAWVPRCRFFHDEKPEASKPISSHYGGERNRLPVKVEFLSCLGDQSKKIVRHIDPMTLT